MRASTVGALFCRIRPVLLWLGVLAARGARRADGWPQWLGPKRDAVWRETGILDKFPKGGPKVRWRTPIKGGYSSPSVADGRVYVTDWAPGRANEVPKSGFDKPRLTGK